MTYYANRRGVTSARTFVRLRRCDAGGCVSHCIRMTHGARRRQLWLTPRLQKAAAWQPGRAASDSTHTAVAGRRFGHLRRGVDGGRGNARKPVAVCRQWVTVVRDIVWKFLRRVTLVRRHLDTLEQQLDAHLRGDLVPAGRRPAYFDQRAAKVCRVRSQPRTG